MQIDMGVPSVGREPVLAPFRDLGVTERVVEDRRTLVKAMGAINQSGRVGPQRELSFIVDQATRSLVVRIVDSETREVVRQVPSDEVLEMASNLVDQGSTSIHAPVLA